MNKKTIAITALAGSAVLTFALLPGVAADAPSGGDAYKIDTVHSSVNFRIKHMNVSYAWGRFNDITGTVAWKADAPEATSFDVEVKTESIDTKDPKRDGHLKGPDFFNAKQFPTMTFKSKSAKKTGDDKLDVTGELTLHGVTKEITVPMEMTGTGKGMRGGSLAGFEATFNVKRSDYGMKNMLNALGDEIRIIVSLEVHNP